MLQPFIMFVSVNDMIGEKMNKRKLLSLGFIVFICSIVAFAEQDTKITKVSTSSNLVEKGKSSNFYSSDNLKDNSYKSWVEGVEGNGIGETITFEFETPIDITGIGIRNGYGDARYYFANSRVKYFEVYVNGKNKTSFLNDIWCFNDMDFYIYKNEKWILDNTNPIFSFIRKDIDKAKADKYQIVFSFGQATGYAGSLYAYVLRVTAPSYTIYEYDFDGISFKMHDKEYKSER